MQTVDGVPPKFRYVVPLTRKVAGGPETTAEVIDLYVEEFEHWFADFKMVKDQDYYATALLRTADVLFLFSFDKPNIAAWFKLAWAE